MKRKASAGLGPVDAPAPSPSQAGSKGPEDGSQLQGYGSGDYGSIASLTAGEGGAGEGEQEGPIVGPGANNLPLGLLVICQGIQGVLLTQVRLSWDGWRGWSSRDRVPDLLQACFEAKGGMHVRNCWGGEGILTATHLHQHSLQDGRIACNCDSCLQQQSVEAGVPMRLVWSPAAFEKHSGTHKPSLLWLFSALP